MSKVHTIQVPEGQAIVIEFRLVPEKPIPLDERALSLEEIENKITGATGMNIQIRSRKTEVLFARFAFFYIANKVYKYSKSEVGRYLDYDHSTVIHGIKTYIDMCGVSHPKMMHIIRKLEKVFIVNIYPVVHEKN